MKKKGFTLVELLAVIVVLGIIMTIAGMSLLGTKKDVNQKEVESIYNTIKELGSDVYLSGTDEDNKIGNLKIYSAATLLEKEYLKSLVNNPSKSGDMCGACLIIDTSKDDNMFDAYVNCDGLDPVGYYKDNNDEVPDECKKDYTKEEIIDESNEEATE